MMVYAVNLTILDLNLNGDRSSLRMLNSYAIKSPNNIK